MNLLDKDVNPHPTWRQITIICFALVIGAMSINGLVYAMSKQVSIEDDNERFEGFKTYKKTVAQVLAEKSITLGEFDEVSPAPSEKVADGERIIINRAVFVNLFNGNSHNVILTAKKTAAEVLQSQDILPTEDMILNVALDDGVFEGMTIKVIYTSEATITTQEPMPFKIIKKPSDKLKVGETKVACEGKEGAARYTYRVFYENGVETSRELLEESIITQPTNKIVEYAPAAPQAVAYNSGTFASRGGDLRYSDVITCNASAYSIKGRTASGMQSQVGAVAVDPSVIPLGTRLYIEAADGSWVYGNAVAADTGGAIKGNKVDLFMNTYQEAVRFGRRTAKVYILE